jgi:hypothetical protein
MSTLLLSGSDVKRLLTPLVCIAAVEAAFRQLAEGAVAIAEKAGRPISLAETEAA